MKATMLNKQIRQNEKDEDEKKRQNKRDSQEQKIQKWSKNDRTQIQTKTTTRNQFICVFAYGFRMTSFLWVKKAKFRWEKEITKQQYGSFISVCLCVSMLLNESVGRSAYAQKRS